MWPHHGQPSWGVDWGGTGIDNVDGGHYAAYRSMYNHDPYRAMYGAGGGAVGRQAQSSYPVSGCSVSNAAYDSSGAYGGMYMYNLPALQPLPTVVTQFLQLLHEQVLFCLYCFLLFRFFYLLIIMQVM